MGKENKFIEVEPEEVNSTIELWQNFGWELVGTPQEINYSTTHRTQETDKYYSSEYTTTTNYVKITFQRDKSIPHYNELVNLQNKYESIQYYEAPIKPEMFNGIWIIITIIGLLWLIPGVIIIIWRYNSFQSKKKVWENDYALWKKQCEKNEKEEDEIIRQAKALIQ